MRGGSEAKERDGLPGMRRFGSCGRCLGTAGLFVGGCQAGPAAAPRPGLCTFHSSSAPGVAWRAFHPKGSRGTTLLRRKKHSAFTNLCIIDLSFSIFHLFFLGEYWFYFGKTIIEI